MTGYCDDVQWLPTADELGWLAHARTSAHHWEVRLYMARGVDSDGKALFGDAFSTDPFDDAPDLTLHVKSTGCMDIDHGECMLHVCDDEGLVELADVVRRARAWAMAGMKGHEKAPPCKAQEGES